MRVGTERVGPRGLTLLGIAGVLGLVLAVRGYGTNQAIAGGAVGAAGSLPASSASSGAGHGHRGGAATTTTGPPSTTPAGGGSTTTTSPPSGGSGSPKQKLGPPLSSSQYASYAFQMYPGSPSAQASTASTGFSIKVTPGTGSFKVSVSAVGTTSAPQTTTYPNGDRVYFVEATLGDDSNNTDYSFGDDGVVVTNAQGRIVE